MKRDKLYVANKWNLPSANVFDLGGDIWSQLATEGLDPTKHSKEELANLTELYKQDRGGLFNMTKEANPFSKGNLMQAGQGLMKGLSGGLSAAAGNMIGGAIADGYSAGSGVGAVTGALQGINLGNPAFNAIKNVAVGTLGGVFNRGLGIKANEANIATIKQSTADKKAAAQEMAGANTTDDLLASAGSMTSSSGFSAGDLYKNGWWTNKGTKKGQALINTENTALAQQNHALGTAAGRVDTKQDDNVMTNFAAFGGWLPQDDSWGMEAGPAIDYGFKSDLLGLKKKQIESRRVPNILYALGGDVQTHGGDFSTGLTSINAGGLHEENPNEGVQMGVDQNGIPNLVEEGEVIWNDYVFSNRIELDEESKKKFHFPKKKDITFADAAKKLEAEISERPNDPISRAGFKAQMEMLAEEQERQKAEMEAQRAEEAFNALSDEEKVALMQQAAQQEQMAQEEAIAEQQEVEPAQGAGMEGQVSPEEAAMMEQQMMQGEPTADAMGTVAPEMAYGGNLYAGGGALGWLKKNHPEMSDSLIKTLAGIMEGVNNKDRKKYFTADLLGNFATRYDEIWRDMIRASSVDAARGTVKQLIRLGVPEADAYNITMSAIAGRDSANVRKVLNTDYQSNDRAVPQAQAAANATSKVKQGHWLDKEGNRFATEQEARASNAAINKRRQAAQQAAAMQTAVVKQEAPAPAVSEKAKPAIGKDKKASTKAVTQPSTSNNGDIVAHKYDWYRNGSDGYSQPWGFTVGSDGLIDTESGYTDEYRDLVSTLGAKDIKDWAVAHLEDPSLQSFLARNYNGSLDAFIADDKFTDDMWRKGATDGKYGFMHHVGSSMLKDKSILDELGIDENALAKSEEESRQFVEGLTRTPRVYHALEGDDDYIEGELDSNVVGDEIRRATLSNGDTVIYHARKTPTANAADKVVVDSNTGEKIVPIHRNENLRYAGLFGPAVGLGMQLAGVGKPDYSRLDAAVESANNVHLADYKPIGNYLAYRPMDIWYEQNRMDANARATDRAIMNNAAPTSTKIAGLLASGYNNQIADSELYRKALEYNDAKRQQVAGFNRGTDQFNAQAYNQNSMFNANALNHNSQMRSQLAMQAANQRLQGDASWYNSLYGNVAGIFKGISDLGRENAEHNRLADLIVSGAIPGVNPDNAVFTGYAKRAAKGGKLKRNKRRGLI